jgi:N-acetylglucosamine-6-phosphate deacetylase
MRIDATHMPPVPRLDPRRERHHPLGRPARQPAGVPALPVVAPGLVDLQINGFAGRDFNALPIPPGTVGEVVRLLWREGVTAFYPTVITNSPGAIEQAVRAIAAAVRGRPRRGGRSRGHPHRGAVHLAGGRRARGT